MKFRSCAGAVMFVLVAAGVLVTPALSQAPKPTVAVPVRFSQILTKYFQFSASDLTALSRGTVVVRSLPAAESREVVVAGAFWCDVPLQYFLTRARDIVAFKKVKEVQQIGVFGRLATAADLARMTLEASDVDALRRCTPGDCSFRLDRAGFERMKKDVAWTSPDAAARANVVARELVAGHVAAYQHDGNRTLIEYADSNKPIRVAQGIDTLLNRSLWLNDAAPGLRQYADAFPRDPSPNAEDVLYWSKVAFGMKPVLAATHSIIWRGAEGAEGAILAKQIYASHYLDASISLTWLVPDGRPGPGGVFVVYQNRSLVDLLQGGFFGPLRRSIARSRTKDGLTGQLEGLKKRLESEFRSTGGKEPGSTGGEKRLK